MAIYELTCIFQPEIKDQKKLIEQIEDWVKDIGGQLKKKEERGKKELAYPIRKAVEGVFVFWALEAEPAKIGELFAKIKLEEKIIRYLLVRTSQSAVALAKADK